MVSSISSRTHGAAGRGIARKLATGGSDGGTTRTSTTGRCPAASATGRGPAATTAAGRGIAATYYANINNDSTLRRPLLSGTHSLRYSSCPPELDSAPSQTVLQRCLSVRSVISTCSSFGLDVTKATNYRSRVRFRSRLLHHSPHGGHPRRRTSGARHQWTPALWLSGHVPRLTKPVDQEAFEIRCIE